MIYNDADFDWKPIATAPRGRVVMTKIDDENGCRNIQPLQLLPDVRRLWFVPSGDMYVYYTPTHWAELP